MWIKSSYCKTDSPMCVEVNGLDRGRVMVRDSKDPGIGFGNEIVFSFTREEWQSFIDGVKAGEFDLKTDDDANAEEMMEQV